MLKIWDLINCADLLIIAAISAFGMRWTADFYADLVFLVNVNFSNFFVDLQHIQN